MPYYHFGLRITAPAGNHFRAAWQTRYGARLQKSFCATVRPKRPRRREDTLRSFSATHPALESEGPPIQPADRERIFERFYRAEESRHRALGTGLGLSISKKAAEAHGGRTWVVSDERAGTTFFFALPSGLRRQYESVARQGSDR